MQYSGRQAQSNLAFPALAICDIFIVEAAVSCPAAAAPGWTVAARHEWVTDKWARGAGLIAGDRSMEQAGIIGCVGKKEMVDSGNCTATLCSGTGQAPGLAVAAVPSWLHLQALGRLSTDASLQHADAWPNPLPFSLALCFSTQPHCHNQHCCTCVCHSLPMTSCGLTLA
jgi:hypothetical protein